MQASVQVIDSTRCNAEDAYQGEVTEKMLCAGVPGGGVDTCQVGPPRFVGSSMAGDVGPRQKTQTLKTSHETFLLR